MYIYYMYMYNVCIIYVSNPIDFTKMYVILSIYCINVYHASLIIIL